VTLKEMLNTQNFIKFKTYNQHKMTDMSMMKRYIISINIRKSYSHYTFET